jgi:hypothetical protein
MKKLGIVLVFGVGVGVGCAAGTAVQPQVAEAQVDEAQVDEAQAPSGGHGWEFRCAVHKKAVELAAAGWEPYAVNEGNYHCLRRPLP